MRVGLTGASGHLGRRVAASLLERLAPGQIVATTRDPGRVGDLTDRGVEVRRADFDDPDSLVTAFAGLERLLIISADVAGRRAEQHGHAVDAAAAAGVQHTIYTSIVRPDPANPIGLVAAEHRATEQRLAASGMTWTALRENIYIQTLIGELPAALASGTWYSNAGEGATAFVARDDIGEVASVLLAEGGGDTAVDVTGPAAVTIAEIAAAAREVTGRPLEVITVDDEAAVQGMLAAGLPDAVARMVADFGRARREGWFADVSDTVPALTGRPATSVADFLAAHRGALTG